MRSLKALVAVALIVVIAIVAWTILRGRNAKAVASAPPTVQGSCPDQSNDLSGIEGWAPGAGEASKMGNAGAGNVGGFGGALGGGDNPAPSPSASTCPHLAPQAAAYFKRARDLAAKMPQDTYLPAKRANELGDAKAAFAWVRDNIATEGYAGAMRGSAGTLQSRGGSPAEKAALLADLLASQGVEARLVHTMLGDADVAKIVAAIAVPHAEPATAAAGDVTTLYAEFDVDRGAARSSLDRTQGAVDATIDKILAHSSEPVAGMQRQLKAARVSIAPDAKALAGTWAAHARDHWWVQARIDGTWTDLDPTLPDLAAGAHLGGAPQGESVAKLPAEMDVTLAIRLVADVANGTSTVQKQLAQTSSAMRDLYAMPITISLGDPNANWQNFASSKSVVASIAEGGTMNASDPFDPANVDGGAVKRIRMIFDTTIPGEHPLHYERTLYDGAAGSAPAIRANALVLSGKLDPVFSMTRDLENASRYGALFAYAAAGGNGSQKPPADGAEAYPMQVMHFFQYDALARTRLEKNDGVRFFFDRPQIALVERSLARDGNALRVGERFDIVENGMTVDAATPESGATANMKRGFFDTLAEQHVLPGATKENTIALWSALGRAPTRVVTNDATYGAVAIVPAKPVAIDGRDRMGWWQIDPAHANLVGRMEGGAGQAMSEYVTTLNDASSYWTAISFYADVLRCTAVGVTSPLRGEHGDAAANTYWQCMSNAACGALEATAMGELYTREDADLRALAYNILDLSFDTHAGASKDSWSPPGVLCNQLFPSDGSNNWSWSGSYG